MSHSGAGPNGLLIKKYGRACVLCVAFLGHVSGPAAQTPAPEILAAAKAGDAAKVKDLLSSNPGLAAARDAFGFTPLHIAASSSYAEPEERNPYLAGLGEYGEKLQAQYMMHVEVARVLVAAGAPVDARDGDDYTPLHWAALRGNRALVALLLKAGAAVNAADKAFLATPLHLAVRAGHPGAVEALMTAEVDLGAKDTYGKTALDYAAESGREDLARLLRRRAGRR
jgi:ankyrin repeat protein